MLIWIRHNSWNILALLQMCCPTSSITSLKTYWFWVNPSISKTTPLSCRRAAVYVTVPFFSLPPRRNRPDFFLCLHRNKHNIYNTRFNALKIASKLASNLINFSYNHPFHLFLVEGDGSWIYFTCTGDIFQTCSVSCVFCNLLLSEKFVITNTRVIQ